MMQKQLALTLVVVLLLGILCACAGPEAAPSGSDSTPAEPSSTDIPGISSSETGGTETSTSVPAVESLLSKYLYLIEEGTFPTEYPRYIDFPDSPTYSLYANLSYWVNNEDHLPKVKETFKGVDKSKKVFTVGPAQVYYPKQMLEILGEIPENTSNIALEQARSICDKWKEQSSNTPPTKEDAFQELNAYAAAPDNLVIYDLTENYYYFINETGTEYIKVIINSLSSKKELYRITYGSDKEHEEVLFSAE